MPPEKLTFAITRIKAHGRNFKPAFDAITADAGAVLTPATTWGMFAGLFGVGSNELVVATSGNVHLVTGNVLALDAVETAETLVLEPTIRPIDATPLSREGLYVFRFFDVAHENVDEIAELSREAWETFEGNGNYEPQGLFCQADRSGEHGRMLLLTWYNDLTAWQSSRTEFPPQARENFQRREALTGGSIAYATRLIV